MTEEPIDHKAVARIRKHHERVAACVAAYNTWSLEDLQLALTALDRSQDLTDPDERHARRCALVTVLSYAFDR